VAESVVKADQMNKGKRLESSTVPPLYMLNLYPKDENRSLGKPEKARYRCKEKIFRCMSQKTYKREA